MELSARSFREETFCKQLDWLDHGCSDGGKVAINLNGKIGNYFRSFKGLRQGDPLSPLLFNIVGDALSEMLNLAKKNGVITCLVPELVEGGLTHLQYADDTILFIENNSKNLSRVKFLLFCFEEMSGLRINYNKSSGEASPENDLGRTFTIKFLHDQSETPRLAARLQAPAPAAHGICCRHRRAPRWGC